MTAKEFILGLQDRVNPEALEGKDDTRFHFQVSGDGGGDFTATIEDGQLDVKEGLEGDPKCTVTTTDEVLMNIVKGKQNPMTAMMFKKIKVSNVTEMTKYAKTLGLM